MHSGFRSYWTYSIGVGIVLLIVLARVATFEVYDLHTFLFVFAGFAIGWLSGTVARYIYPPPISGGWRRQRSSDGSQAPRSLSRRSEPAPV
jgi:hypothetical protein